jgi:[ribosomal protein S18]-alanine N-acetyltransferase
LGISGSIVKIRPATCDDVLAIWALERASPSASHWTELQYREIFQLSEAGPERIVLVAESLLTSALEDATSSIDGFLVAQCVTPEWELENIVVASAARRRGIGRQLLEMLLTTARKTNSEAVFLEVRESNVSARSLYEKLGFRRTGSRPAYYINPSEDAILYRRDLP